MATKSSVLLSITDLHVYYGRAHVLHGVNLTLDQGVLAVVGRNGMGKTTLCNTLLGLLPAQRGSAKVGGREILGLTPHQIVDRGVAYVPQGRRVWPSLSVDEHLRVAQRGGKTVDWTAERIYELFPRLAERRRNGGAQLSGGEQQMLAIGRALLANPKLLIMDEPTEGLAPVMVELLTQTLQALADEGLSVLLIEQNLGVSTQVADRVAVMVNGRIARELTAANLAADHELQQQLLGVSAVEAAEETEGTGLEALPDQTSGEVFQVVRRATTESTTSSSVASAAMVAPPLSNTPNRWGQQFSPLASSTEADDSPQPAASVATTVPVASSAERAAYVTGTFDTKGRELSYIAGRLRQLGLRVVTVDLSTSRQPSPADVGATEVASHHPQGTQAVFSNDRGAAVTAMAEAFERFVLTRRDIGGMISAGGSGGTALATPAMQKLAIGVPKVMLSTIASGDVKRYVGPVDICMMYSVTDVAGINRISEQILANAAHALAGMILNRREHSERETKPAIGLTMFGVTTVCVQQVAKLLDECFDCLIFHATGTGGQSMEKLVDSGLLTGVLDITTTEVADLHMGGFFSAGEGRLDAIARSRVPYVGSCGALDMVNWGAMDTVPDKFRQRNLYVHNPQITLMRTTVDENIIMGRWIADKLNRCDGPVRFLIPEGGVSLIDAPGQPFHDPDADRALFQALEHNLRQTGNRRLIRLPYNINEPEFAQALVDNFLEIMKNHALSQTRVA